MLWALRLWASPAPDPHTLLLLHLDEGTGEICIDASGMGIQARLDAEPRRPQWADGRFGNCLRFDGDNADHDGDGKGEADGLLVTGTGKLAQSGPVTVEMWVMPERLDGRQTLCALNCMNGRYTFFLDGAAMDLWMAFADEKGEGTYRNLRSGPVLSVGEWQHVAFTFGKGEMKTFLNAVEVARLSVPLERYRADQTATTTIGRDGDLRPVPSGIRGFKGMIDEVRISDIDRERFDVPESLISATRERIDRHVTEAPDVTRGSRFGERRACEVYGSSQWRDPVIVRYDQHSLQRHLRCGSQARGVGGP